ncbi:non-ribosomal peptide synthetase [Hymenobacter nivis]|uniref:Amino acid adenylation domain-containing protein n=1 Tax=Hymenobacter nivis TaxID=1850093 RepID=A0A502GIT9_9BACT|nr:non-ribosomal peptide synthetase [Hymenobacter nivis]TPG61721.1 amino acid adenylation domain-containing protein [Hymenobacter nivis]
MEVLDTWNILDFDPFAGPEIVRLAPLTEPQAEIWAACLVGGDDANRAYNEAVALRLTGPLDRPALQRALDALVAQHEALRATFSADGRHLCILTPEPLPLACHDLTAQTPAEQRQWLAAHARQEVLHVFSLTAGPLLRVSLAALSDTDHCLTLTAHHIVCDGWSIGVMLQDLGQLYSAYAQQMLPFLPAPPTFSSYAAEQAAFYQSADYGRVEQFWVEQYRGPVPVLDVPTDFPRPAARTYASRRQDYPLPPPLLGALKQMGQKAGCSFVTTLLAGFEVFMHQLTGQTDLVVGLPAAGQAPLGATRLVGHCVNLLPLRSRPTGELRFVDYLKQRKAALFDAYDHQALTFGSLLKKLPVARGGGRLPLVPVVFNIDLGLGDGVAFHGLTHALSSLPRAYENFELFVNASGSASAMTVEWSYNAALFEPATIDQLMARFEQLLSEIAENPNVRLRDLRAPLAPAYAALNATAQPYPATQTLHQLVATQARATPTKTAVQCGPAALTYQQLEGQANQLAHYLLVQGVQPGDVVALVADRSPALLVVLLAIVKCGAAYLPLDPVYPPDRIAYMLADSQARVLIASARLRHDFGAPAQVLVLEEILAALPNYPDQAPAVPVASEQLAYVLYTSGSTGQPKGVQVTHRNVVNFLCSMQQVPGLESTDKLLAVTTVSFDIAGLELFLPLVTGATVVLAEAAEARDGHLLLQLLETAGITAMQATPATWQMLLDAGWSRPLPLKALCGGEALPAELARQLLPRCQSLWNLYGPTETTIWSAVKQITDPAAAITIGHPIANTQFYVVDENLRPVKPGAVGELLIGGDGVTSGYLHKPALTHDRFIANPFGAPGGALLYRTGDLGKLLPTGELQCLGRLDQQVKLRGYRIELGEIEHALAAIDGIKAAVVVAGAPNTPQAHLHAHVLADDNWLPSDLDTRLNAWKKVLHKQLPAYMVPARFTIQPAFPLTANGKIDRLALASVAGPMPAPTPGLPEAAPTKVSYVGPRTDVEKTVAAIWAPLLGLERVSIYDDFFELGGHSLIAVQVMAQLAQQTGKRLPLAALFEHPTVEKIASMLALDSKLITWDSLVPIKPSGRKKPIYIVHGAGLNVLIFNALSKNMDPDQPVYGLQARGLNGIDEPLGTVEEIAAHYVSAVVANDPVGPYALAGYSFGGIIAYEMARQLAAAGKKIKALIVFDTYASEAYSAASPLKKRLSRFKYNAGMVLHNVVLLGKNPRGIIRHRITTAQSTFNKYYLRFSGGEAKQHELFFQQPLKVEAAINQAAECYVIKPQAVKLDLFRVRKTFYYMHDTKYMGWKNLALGGITVSEIPGEHNLLFAPPHDVEIARILQDVLDGYN